MNNNLSGPRIAKSGISDHIGTYGLGILITLIGFIVAFQFVEPAPPTTITIVTGSPQGAYYNFAKSYREILARDGITLRVIETAGSVENLQHLTNEQEPADLALVQGGIDSPDESLTSLGSLYFEPLWVLHRSDDKIMRLSDLQGMRIAIDKEGSGTYALSRELLQKNGIHGSVATITTAGGEQAAEDLLGGKLDAMFMVASPTSPLLQKLFYAPNIKIMHFNRAEAYARAYPYLSVITLPEGVLDFAKNIPNSKQSLLATTANLVAHPNLHPALVSLLLEAAEEVHGAGGLFERPGQFPSAQFIGYPLNKAAKHFYEHGPSFLQRYLPFWAANMIDRLKIMLLPLVGLLLPLFKLMPPIYRWRVRSRIYRWYSELQQVDPKINSMSPIDIEAALIELERIESEVTLITVPLSYVDELYDLRLHIDMVRQKLESMVQNQTPDIEID